MAKKDSVVVEPAAPDVAQASSLCSDETGTKLVTILYSIGRELYRVPSIEKPCWLSVQVYPPPPMALAADAIYLGPSTTADGNGWRKAFARTWRTILNGDCVTLPADDPMVLDYATFGEL